MAHGDRAGLVELLLALGLVDETVARELEAAEGRGVDALALLRDLSDDLVAQALARHLDLLLLRPEAGQITPDWESLLPGAFCLERLVLPVRHGNGRLLLAMADPADEETVDEVRRRCGLEVERAVAPASILADCLGRLDAPAPRRFLFDLGEELGGDHPLIRELLDELLVEARRNRSDAVHLEPFHGGWIVRHRREGALEAADHLPRRLARGLAEALRVLSGLPPAPAVVATAFLDHELHGESLRIRVQCQQTCRGDRWLLDFPPRRLPLLAVNDLGLDDGQLALLRRKLSGGGLTVFTGLTGSGRTTSLQAFLADFAGESRSVFSVEYVLQTELPGVQQLELRPAEGFSFPEALERIASRERPDLVALADFSCSRTMAAALRAAERGITIMAASPGRSPEELFDRFVLNGLAESAARSLRCVVHQRRLRKLCPDCSRPYEAPHALGRHLGIETEGASLRRATLRGSCSSCGGRGHRGSLVVFEVLEMDEALRVALRGGASKEELAALRRERIRPTLRERALALALAGETSLEEAVMATTDRRDGP